MKEKQTINNFYTKVNEFLNSTNDKLLSLISESHELQNEFIEDKKLNLIYVQRFYLCSMSEKIYEYMRKIREEE